MKFTFLTLFPGLVQPYFEDSILKRGLEGGHFELEVINIRDHSTDKHQKTDDSPYGGGAGMVMTCQPLFDSIAAAKEKNAGPVIYLSPAGARFTQEKAEELAQKPGLILLCGRYEGIDERVRERLVDEEISLGDFVLTGGELPALAVVDAVARLLPGVLGHEESAEEESFSEKLGRMIEYPHYTKPAEYEGMKVPEVLLSGHHAEIQKWRQSKLKESAQSKPKNA